MYARYVPPSKKPVTTASAAPVAEPSPSLKRKHIEIVEKQIPTPTKQDASSSYARYVPPSKSTSKPQRQEPVANSIQPLDSSLQSAQSLGDSHEHFRRPVESTPHLGVADNTDEAEDRLEDDVQFADADQSTPKKVKKPKREKKDKKQDATADHVMSETADDAPADSGDDESRHRSVLAKRAKSLKKAEKLARKAAEKAAAGGQDEAEVPADEEPVEVHPLQPLPQPEQVPDVVGKPSFSALPPWLASPIRISMSATASFGELGIAEEIAKTLQTKGYTEAFAVQAAVLPLLLPGPKQQPGDVLVSAATGSGKTLAYVLPMVNDISVRTVTRLRGLIVMPTRELVAQAREVCEVCATAFTGNNRRRVKTGVAVGQQALKVEQEALMEKSQRYDPVRYREEQRRLNAKWESSSNEDDAEELNFYEDESSATLPDHVLEYTSKIDILVCTPGRLVEHIKSTPGFTLADINWLVIDEADRLLDQSFQQWTETVMSKLPKTQANHLTTSSTLQARRPLVRKIVLSATMTRDIGQLVALKLRRPKMIVLEGSDKKATADSGDAVEIPDASGAYTLPDALIESAIKVDNEGEKPLYLWELLRTRKMVPIADDDTSMSDVSSVVSSSSEESDSDDDSSDSSSSGSSSSDSESVLDSDVATPTAPLTPLKPATLPSPPSTTNNIPHGVLIFTKSNESALRLSRLLTLLSPNAPPIGTLTSTIRNSVRAKTLSAFTSGRVSILVASDLVSRGLDLPNLAHIVNYDMPTSVTSYVHRVGRTARAGRKGDAWTLFTASEGRWFWNEIARSEGIKRVAEGRVNRVTMDAKAFAADDRKRYERALETLGKEASASSRARTSAKD